MDTAQLWARSRAGDAQSRSLLIERYLPLAKGLSRRVRTTETPVTDGDDMASAAFLGLIDAVDRFEPGRGVPFEAYARLRIRGAMIDELRRTTERSRTATQEEQPRVTSLDLILDAGRTDMLPFGDGGLDEGHEEEDLRGRVEVALDTLPERQREVLTHYYKDDLTLRQTGAHMGISEARACQLHGRAIVNLRRALSVRLPQVAVAAAASAA
ncbi:MAG: sigma-70 family RNA polymerase sigma factor [Chloroflexota bacterium]|nr:sigma-70 family RNA polymerase sigma factor [Chloroflexota bacterium]